MSKSMTVKEVIEFLSKIKDKDIVMIIDCPFCGKGNQLEKVTEVVIFQAATGRSCG